MMKIETYQDPIHFFENIIFKQDELHITNIPIFSIYLKNLSGNKKETVWMYHHLQKALFTKWNGAMTQVTMKMVLRSLLQPYLEENRAIVNGFLKNMNNLLDSYRILIELEINHIPVEYTDSMKEQIFLKVFNEFIRQKEIRQISTELKEIHSDRDLSLKLNIWARKNLGLPNANLQQINRIYIYHFKHLSAERYSFLKQLEQMGIEIIFRIPYYPEQKHINDPWVSLYAPIIDFSRWQTEEVPLSVDSKILDYLEGRAGRETGNQNEKMKYIHFHEPAIFKKYLINHPIKREKIEYLAFSKDILNDSMRDVIEGDKNIGHTFDHPIGKFLFSFYSIKKEEETIELNYDTYVQCMTSGWVEIPSSSGNQFISGISAHSLLKDLKPCMEGVTTIDEIIERIDGIKLMNDGSRVFEDLGRSKSERNRIKRYLLNPFRVFSYNNPGRYDITINQLRELTVQLKDMITDLFGEDNQFVVLNDHFEILKKYWSNLHLSDFMDDDQFRKIKNTIDEALNYHFPPYEMATFEDTKEILSILTNPEKEDQKNEEAEVSLIKNIDQILGLMGMEAERIYFIDFSVKSMEQYAKGHKGLTTYLTYDRLAKYTERIQGSNIKETLLTAVEVGKRAEDHILDFLKFDLFLALTFFKGEIYIGWIENLYEYDQENNLLKVIKTLYKLEDVTVEIENRGIEQLFVLNSDNDQKINKQINRFEGEIAPMGWRDLEFCPKKFYYSNILGHYPVYSEDFHQRLAFGVLCRIFEDQNKGKEKVKELLFPLFPQWTDALKENIMITFSRKKLKDNEFKFQNVNFPKDMMNLQILKSKHDYDEYDERVQKKTYDDLKNNVAQWMDEFLGNLKATKVIATPGSYCSMCPHRLICQEGEFPIDRE